MSNKHHRANATADPQSPGAEVSSSTESITRWAYVRWTAERLAASSAGLLCFLIVLELALRVLGGTYGHLHHQNGVGQQPTSRADTTVILAVGDSMTYGVGASPGQDYPAQLQRLLNGGEDDGPYRVVNGGIGGANSSMIRERLPWMLDEVQPDIVMLMAGTANSTNYHGYHGASGSGPGFDRWLTVLQTLRIVRLVRVVSNTLGGSSSVELEPVYDGTIAAVAAYLSWHRNNHASSTIRLDDPTFLAGVRMLRAGRFDAAEALFADALEASPSCPHFAWGLGTSQTALREYRQAIASFETCTRLEPSDPNCYYGVGEALIYMGPESGDNPYTWFHRASELAPRFPGAYWGMAMSSGGNSPGQARHQRFDLFIACIEADPDDSRCYPNLVMQAARDPVRRAQLEEVLEKHASHSRPARGSLRMLRDNFDPIEILTWVAWDLDAMVELTQARGLPTIMHGYPYPEALNRAIQGVATRHHLPYVDHLENFEEVAVGPQRPTYFARDGFHCSDLGYELMATGLLHELTHNPTLAVTTATSTQ